MTSNIVSLKMRSWLFAPGDSEKKMAKAAAGAADIAIFDLEDAVAPEEKPKARAMVRAFLEAQPQDRSRLQWPARDNAIRPVAFSPVKA